MLLPLALLLALLGVAGFIWATRSGQFDDLETPAMRMLHDDNDPIKQNHDSRPCSDSKPPSQQPSDNS